MSIGASPLLRVHTRVPPTYVEAFRRRGANGQKLMLADLERRVSRGGARVLLSLQDPTDESHVAFLVRGTASGDEVVTLVGAETVEEPPSWPLVGSIAIGASVPLEPGMLEEEARAVALALRVERSPRHLEGFAHTLDPYMPCAASLLRERAATLEPGADVRSASGNVDVEAARRARASLPDLGLPPELTNLEIKRAASMLAQGEDTNAVPLGVLDVAAKTLRRTKTRLKVGGEGRENVYVVDHAAMLAAAPPVGTEAFVSPSALQLALSATKPKISGVARFDRSRSLFEELKNGNVAPEDRRQLLLARAMLEKARSAIERRRWVEWYRKQA